MLKPPAPTRSSPAVTVVMRCKNSDWVIGQALAGLYSQTFRDFELLVVDSGSRDRTLDIVRSYPARLIEIEPSSYVPGRVLNAAIEAARGELIVFQNSDVVPLGPDCLAHLLQPFEEPRVEAAFARQAPRPEALPWVRRDYAASFPDQGPAPPWIKLSLPLAAIRRSAWEQRRFYELAWASEDTEWGAAAEHRGAEIRYVPEAAVMHSHNYTLREIYGRRFVEGEADAFIDPADESSLAWRWLPRACRAAYRDLQWSWHSADWRGVGRNWLRRAVYHWAHGRGRRWGRRRRQTANSNLGAGQRIILQRHDAAQPRAVSGESTR